MTSPLGQMDQLTEFHEALRQEFETSWSPYSGLVVFGAFAVVVLLVWCLSRREMRSAEDARQGDPDRLFRDLLKRLPLAVSQKEWLTAMVHALKIRHPAGLLLSPELLERSYEEWVACRNPVPGGAGQPSDRHLLAQVRAALFPHGRGSDRERPA